MVLAHPRQPPVPAATSGGSCEQALIARHQCRVSRAFASQQLENRKATYFRICLLHPGDSSDSVACLFLVVVTFAPNLHSSQSFRVSVQNSRQSPWDFRPIARSLARHCLPTSFLWNLARSSCVPHTVSTATQPHSASDRDSQKDGDAQKDAGQATAWSPVQARRLD